MPQSLWDVESDAPGEDRHSERLVEVSSRRERLKSTLTNQGFEFGSGVAINEASWTRWVIFPIFDQSEAGAFVWPDHVSVIGWGVEAFKRNEENPA
jgi:hypothetical protein